MRSNLVVEDQDDDDRPLRISGAKAAQIFGVVSELYVSRLVGQGAILKAVKHCRRGLERIDV